MSINIKFCGAAGVVTGSCYKVTTPQGAFLIDCGLFQGTKTVRELNYGSFGFDPKTISFVLVTHAHIDHSGLLPKLVREGFSGKIYTTAPTRDLLEYMLPDSANIQETEVRQLNVRNEQRGLPEIFPIYTHEDAEQCLSQIESLKMNGWIDLPLGVRARLWNAGHILGAVSIELKVPVAAKESPVHILFSGDLGPDNKILQSAPEQPQGLDYIVVESTYGDRERVRVTHRQRRDILRQEILDALTVKGNIIIPAFAVERTQELLLDLDWLIDHGELPEVPLFIDSPLATKVTGVFDKYHCEMEDLAGEKCPFHGRNIRYTSSVEDSKNLARIKSGAIIMAASGMCEAGRIRYHLKQNLWNPHATILFAGYQAEGTLGRFIRDGAKRVRIQGEEIDVKARIRSLDHYSAHADQKELVAWVKACLPVAKNIFLTHGTEDARLVFQQRLAEAGINPMLIIKPSIDEEFALNGLTAQKIESGKPRITPVEMAATDWHNDYARFVLDLAQYLRSLPDAENRHKFLNDLMRHLAPSNGHARHAANGKK